MMGDLSRVIKLLTCASKPKVWLGRDTSRELRVPGERRRLGTTCPSIYSPAP